MIIECLTTLPQFEAVRDDWNVFTSRHFPECYARTHAWLCAWWSTYHRGKKALVFIGRDGAGGEIVAAAPLLIRYDNFGGFPVRMLQSLGFGLGSDDFLLSRSADEFPAAIFKNLGRGTRWDVATFHRATPEGPLSQCQILRRFIGKIEQSETSDFYLELPATYEAYLKSRSSKFRNNLLQATRRLGEEGVISLERVDPFREPDRVWEVCGAVAKQSWQFKEGKSHFNDNGARSFYRNLARFGEAAGGEEFLVLLAGEKPFAFLFGCRRGRSYYLVDTAYDSRYRSYSVGRVLFARTVQLLIERGDVDRFYLEGGGDYKDHFATACRTVHLLTMYNRTMYGWGIQSLRQSRLYHMIRARRG